MGLVVAVPLPDDSDSHSPVASRQKSETYQSSQTTRYSTILQKASRGKGREGKAVQLAVSWRAPSPLHRALAASDKPNTSLRNTHIPSIAPQDPSRRKQIIDSIAESSSATRVQPAYEAVPAPRRSFIKSLATGAESGHGHYINLQPALLDPRRALAGWLAGWSSPSTLGSPRVYNLKFVQVIYVLSRWIVWDYPELSHSESIMAYGRIASQNLPVPVIEQLLGPHINRWTPGHQIRCAIGTSTRRPGLKRLLLLARPAVARPLTSPSPPGPAERLLALHNAAAAPFVRHITLWKTTATVSSLPGRLIGRASMSLTRSCVGGYLD
ncbi:uncharacterized protein LY89DRAFT_749619 [Mollisia scopiformis]|uniref:Uncharacterized protein n=1 Tax=Mollisia scopiformis TaxID=149040 RepID=A0A194X653_MOLSC|nr:uncharacterized protein LY89DRAFT_749619 [Mollisia scopiformis]KUJ15660.1 hypothetical protein LY89DRAFT_749619 [Mollisia scopiformis]